MPDNRREEIEQRIANITQQQLSVLSSSVMPDSVKDRLYVKYESELAQLRKQLEEMSALHSSGSGLKYEKS